MCWKQAGLGSSSDAGTGSFPSTVCHLTLLSKKNIKLVFLRIRLWLKVTWRQLQRLWNVWGEDWTGNSGAKAQQISAGLEPETLRTKVRFLNHWATAAPMNPIPMFSGRRIQVFVPNMWPKLQPTQTPTETARIVTAEGADGTGKQRFSEFKTSNWSQRSLTFLTEKLIHLVEFTPDVLVSATSLTEFEVRGRVGHAATEF